MWEMKVMLTLLVKREITTGLKRATTKQNSKIVSPLIINSSIGTGIDKTLQPYGLKSKQFWQLDSITSRTFSAKAQQALLMVVTGKYRLAHRVLLVQQRQRGYSRGECSQGRKSFLVVVFSGMWRGSFKAIPPLPSNYKYASMTHWIWKVLMDDNNMINFQSFSSLWEEEKHAPKATSAVPVPN